MIKAILFDLDGVLTMEKTGSKAILKYLCANTDLSYDKLESCYGKYNEDLLNGVYTHKDIWNELCMSIVENIPYSLLIDAFEATEMNTDMLLLLRKWKETYKTGLITDNKADRIETIGKKYDFEDLFDVVAVSADLHTGKKEKKIFEFVLHKLDLLPEECIFIDNSKGNLIMPSKMGIHTIWFDDEKKDHLELKAKVQFILDNE